MFAETMDDNRDKLPASAQAHLRYLQTRADGCLGALRVAQDATNALHSKIAEAKARLTTLQAERVHESHPDLQRQRQIIQNAEAKLPYAAADLERKKDQWQQAANLVSGIKRFLTSNTEFCEAGGIDYPKAETADIVANLAKLRDAVTGLKQSLASLDAAPLSIEDVSASVASSLDKLAAAGAPNFDAMLHGGAGELWSEKRNRVHILGQSVTGYVVDTPALPVLVWLLRGQLEAAVNKALMEKHGGSKGLTQAQREAEAQCLNAKLLQYERHEEHLIRLGEKAGFEIARRHDADPRAVLGLQ